MAGLKELSSKLDTTPDGWVPTTIKQVVKDTMHAPTLTAWLRSVGRDRLAAQIDALNDVRMFEEHFVDRVVPTKVATRSRLPLSIFRQAVDAGVITPLPRRYRPPISAPLKAVPDRKDPTVGRLILPACRLNDSCRDPDVCPIPRLPEMIHSLLGAEWLITADLRSWFFSFGLSPDVAAKYFATRGPDGRFYAHVRGAMGWSHMPYIACSVADALVKEAAGSANAFAWIDDLSIGTATRDDALRASAALTRLAAHIGAELRDLTHPARTATIVGVQIDLRYKRWRLDPQWADKFRQLWQGLSTAHRLPARIVWRLAGYVAWATYALQLPLALSALGSRLAMASIDLPPDTHIDAREIIRLLEPTAAIACANPWRQFAPPPTMTIVTDASLTGLGVVTRDGQWNCRVKWDEHINALEVAAIQFGLSRNNIVDATVNVIVDNRVVFYALMRWRTRGRGQLHDRITRLLRYCTERRVNIRVGWIPTDLMHESGADCASRGELNAHPDIAACLAEAQWHNHPLVTCVAI
jgi:hypothetical protein